MTALDRWRNYIKSHDKSHDDKALWDLLHPDAVFESPVVHTPQRGREITFKYLASAGKVLGGPSLSPQLPDDQTRPASGRAARSSPYGFASCSPISRCSKLIALSGRTITLKCVIRLPSALKVIMSTPLILIPSISVSNSSTTPLSLRHSPTYLKFGPPITLSAVVRYLNTMSRPRCAVCTTGLSNTASGCSRSRTVLSS